MQTLETTPQLRQSIHHWRQSGDRIALVPTMGNLHAGHLQLVEAARDHADRVVVSIFVNPMQFSDASGNGGDFERYPRTFEADCVQLSAHNADAVFAPSVAEVYPSGLEQSSRIEVPGISDILCGEFRPGHFVGVATVVAKLFNMVQADVALFGEKDYQQLLVIQRLVADLCFPIDVIAVPTIREANGLAMSSRNQYLSAAQREQAAVMYQTLLWVRQHIGEFEGDFAALEAQACARLVEAGFRPEYVAIRRAQDLLPPSLVPGEEMGLRILAAAWLGEARLIDNIPVPNID
jgi:pantoate--beta-alanine ligase